MYSNCHLIVLSKTDTKPLKKHLSSMNQFSLDYVLLWYNKNILLSIGVLCFFLIGCATTDPFAGLDEWKAIQSKHFIVYTNAKETVAVDTAKEFETFRATALKITTVPLFEEPYPVRIYLFKDKNHLNHSSLQKTQRVILFQGKTILPCMPFLLKRTSIPNCLPRIYPLSDFQTSSQNSLMVRRRIGNPV